MCMLGRVCECGLLRFLGWARLCHLKLELVDRPLGPGAGDFPAGIAWCVGTSLTALRVPAPFVSLKLSNLAQLPQLTGSKEVEGFQVDT